MSLLSQTFSGPNLGKALMGQADYRPTENDVNDPYHTQNRASAWAGWNPGAMDDLTGQLVRRSKGLGQSLAEMELNRATERNTGLGAALMATQPGVNPALALRTSLLSNAETNQQAAGQSAILRAKEQLDAEMGLGALLNQSRQTGLGYDWNQQQAKMGLVQALSAIESGNANRGQQGLGALLNGVGTLGAAYIMRPQIPKIPQPLG